MFLDAPWAVLWLVVVGCGSGSCHCRCPASVVPFHAVVPVVSWLVTLCHQVYTSKFATDMNLFYSLGDSNVFLALQTYTRSADALGGCLAGIAGTYLFTLNPIAPFALGAFVSSALACEGNICSLFGVFHGNFCQVIVLPPCQSSMYLDHLDPRSITALLHILRDFTAFERFLSSVSRQ